MAGGNDAHKLGGRRGLLLHASRGSQGVRRRHDGNAQIGRGVRMTGAQTRCEQRWPGQANTVWGMLVLRQPREVRQMVDEAGRLRARH
jgi:hypothetical protein